jgi:hypothetical protein
MQKKFCQNINDVMQITDVMRISDDVDDVMQISN